MTDILPTIPPNARVEEVCDYCYRPFTRAVTATAICPSCGLVNVRSVRPPAERAPESTMLAPAVERAVLPTAKPRPAKKSAPRKRKA
jgi:uncharacterized Zn finger protein (UPF0148 family)